MVHNQIQTRSLADKLVLNIPEYKTDDIFIDSQEFRGQNLIVVVGFITKTHFAVPNIISYGDLDPGNCKLFWFGWSQSK